MILMSTGPLRNQSYKMKIEPSLESPEVWHRTRLYMNKERRNMKMKVWYLKEPI